MVVMIEGAPGIKWVGARDAAQHFTPENDPAPNVDNAINPSLETPNTGPKSAAPADTLHVPRKGIQEHFGPAQLPLCQKGKMRHNWGLPGAAHSLIIPSFTQIIWGRYSHSRYVGAVGTQWRGPLGEECGKEDWQVGLAWGMKASVAGRRAVGKADWPNLPCRTH